jgi:hypothetical protein
VLLFFPNYYGLYAGQLNGLLFLFSVCGLHYMRRAKPWQSGFFLALATMIKFFPGLLLLLILIKRQFRVLIAAVLSIAALVVLSLIVLGYELHAYYFTNILPLEACAGTYLLARNHGFTGAVMLLILCKSWEHYAVFLLLPYLLLIEYVLFTDPRRMTLFFLAALSFCIRSFAFTTTVELLHLPKHPVMNVILSAPFISTLVVFGCLLFILRKGMFQSETGELPLRDVAFDHLSDRLQGLRGQRAFQSTDHT